MSTGQWVYAVFLLLCGLAMIAVAVVPGAPRIRRSRGVTGVFGGIYTIYGLYLVAARPAHTIIFFYVFIFPILFAVRYFRGRSGTAGYGQPQGYGQQGYGQPQQGYGQPQSSSRHDQQDY